MAEARAQGRAEAMAELTAALDEQRAATDGMRAAAAALTTALAGVAAADVDRVHDVEQHVLTMALALAEEVIGRAVEADERLAITSAARALSLAPDRGTVALRVNPADVAVVRDALERELAGATDAGATPIAGHLTHAVQVVADPSVERAGAVADVGPLRIDAQIGAVLARIRDSFAS